MVRRVGSRRPNSHHRVGVTPTAVTVANLLAMRFGSTDMLSRRVGTWAAVLGAVALGLSVFASTRNVVSAHEKG